MFTSRVGACWKRVRACERRGKVPSVTSLGADALDPPCHHGHLDPAFREQREVVGRPVAWLEVNQDDCYISSIVVAQLAHWVGLQRGERRTALQKWLTKLTDAMHGRILGFNVSVAHVMTAACPFFFAGWLRTSASSSPLTASGA
jgi:hypothetical protein